MEAKLFQKKTIQRFFLGDVIFVGQLIWRDIIADFFEGTGKFDIFVCSAEEPTLFGRGMNDLRLNLLKLMPVLLFVGDGGCDVTLGSFDVFFLSELRFFFFCRFESSLVRSSHFFFNSENLTSSLLFLSAATELSFGTTYLEIILSPFDSVFWGLALRSGLVREFLFCSRRFMLSCTCFILSCYGTDKRNNYMHFKLKR